MGGSYKWNLFMAQSVYCFSRAMFIIGHHGGLSL